MKNTQFYSVLHGCLLGDGCLEMHKNGTNACFSYVSSSKEHTEFIHDFFREYCTPNYQEVKRIEVFDYRTNKTYTSFRFKTRCLPIFTEVYNQFYIDGTKIVPQDVIINSTSNLFWYIGDGELERNWSYVKLHTNSFTLKDVLMLCDRLSEYKAKPQTKGDAYLVTIPRIKTKQFLEDIGSCPVSDYAHKWDYIPYKNEKYAQGEVMDYSEAFSDIIKEFKSTEKSIYRLSKEFNVPIRCIKNHFTLHDIPWTPIKTTKIIEQYNLEGVKIGTWLSGQEVKRKLGYSASAISECCRGKRKTYKSFIWKFKN